MKISVLLASAVLLTGPPLGTALAQDVDELASANHELREARENLAIAAREVARLSARANAPYVGGLMRDFERMGRRAMLGVNISDDEDGVRVEGVTPGGPADDSGVETGDIVTAINGAELAGTDEGSPSETMIGFMTQVEPGEEVTLTIVRDGDEQEIEIEANMIEPRLLTGSAFETLAAPYLRGGMTAEMPQSLTLRAVGPLGRWSDMELVELTPSLGAYFGTDEGILVVRAPSDEELELEDGDVILEISGRAPMSREHAMRILGSFEVGETLELTIMRDQRRQTLEIEVTAGGRQG